MARRKDSKDQFQFQYRMGVKITLIVITLLLAGLIPVSWMDQSAWIHGVPVIFVALIPIVIYFIYIIFADTNQKIEVRKESILLTSGVGPLKKTVEIGFDDFGEFHDDTTLFSVGRKYSLISASDPKKRIRLNGALSRYRELLQLVLKRIPRSSISARAMKSLQRSRIISS